MMVDRAELGDRCRSLMDQGMGREGLISFLRQAGCFKIDSIAILMDVLHVDLSEAKPLVHLSETWKDRREEDDLFHERIAEAIEMLRLESPGQ